MNDITSLSRLKRRVLSALEFYKKSSRFFKMRVYVVVGVLGLSLISLSMGLLGADRNKIGADIDVRHLLGAHIVHVRNESTEAWTDIRVTLDGEWVYQRRTLRPQERMVVRVEEFEKSTDRGSISAEDFSPNTVKVSTSTGSYSWTASKQR